MAKALTVKVVVEPARDAVTRTDVTLTLLSKEAQALADLLGTLFYRSSSEQGIADALSGAGFYAGYKPGFGWSKF